VRTIGVVSGARSDYGIYLPILKKIREDSALDLYLIVSGMHLSPEFGYTAEMIEADGFRIDERVEMLLSSQSPEGISKSMGLGTIGFSACFTRKCPDILVLLGDRFEMHAAAVAAVPFGIPIAHIHGGEITEGAMDDAFRHSITKLSHLHFVSTEVYRRRIIQMGEEPWRITVSGAPSLDNLHAVSLLSVHELEIRYGLNLEKPPLLVTFHPATLEYKQIGWQTGELLAAIKSCKVPAVFTLPNADTGSREIIKMIKDFVERSSLCWLIENMGIQAYFSLMSVASAMVGNSSSGIVEAASFKLPVVNIGTRQAGRVRGANVIDTGYRREEIIEGIARALDPEFRAGLENLKNPYGKGCAASMIVNVLKEVELNDKLIKKHFNDLVFFPWEEGTDGA